MLGVAVSFVKEALRANAFNYTHFAMNLPNRRAAKLILLGDLCVRVRVRVRISGENRTRTPTRTLPSLKLDAFALTCQPSG